MGNNFKILGVIVLVTVLGAAGWFFVTKQSQNGADLTQKGVEIKNDNRQEEQVAKEDSQKQGEEKVEELKTEDIDTSNWKIYRNEELGFEFKLPEYTNKTNNEESVLFKFVNDKNIKSLIVKFSKSDPAWWTDPNREFPTTIKEVSRYSIVDKNVIYYETTGIVINKKELDGTISNNRLIAIINCKNIYVEVDILGNDFEKLRETADGVVKTLKENDM